MEKLLFSSQTTNLLVVFLMATGLQSQVHAQKQSFKFSYCNTSFSVFKDTVINGQIVVDTLCTEGIIRNHNRPMAFCQNDSLFFVLSQLYFADAMRYELYIYKKEPNCKYIRMLKFEEKRDNIIKKTLVKSINNKIVIEVNDNGKIFVIVEFDPYKTTLESFIQQFFANSGKI